MHLSCTSAALTLGVPLREINKICLVYLDFSKFKGYGRILFWRDFIKVSLHHALHCRRELCTANDLQNIINMTSPHI